jgi:hypothetical protein
MWLPLRHPYHPSDQRLEHDAARELIATGDLSQQRRQNGIRVQPGSLQNVIERPARRKHIVSISRAANGSRMP